MPCARAQMQTLDNGYVVRKTDGAVVTHPALTSLPFERSIEHWVRDYFAFAQYSCHDDTRVVAADIPIDAPGALVIQAPKGTGKSKAICAAISRLPPKTSVVQITFRRSLAWSSCFMLGADAQLYSSIEDAVISARHHPRLTILINSVARVRGCYDVVVIDEIVSVLDMLSGPLLDAATRVATCTVLASLIGNARTVIIADAMLDATCIDFVLLCRQITRAEIGERLTSMPPLRVLDYVTRIHSDYSYVPHASLDTWMAAIKAAVAARQRIVVPCMTKAQALRVRDACTALLPAHEVYVYTADTEPTLLRAHMSDIHAHWSAARVLIYSPVITAGCSFELAHFDTVFFYGYAGTGAVRGAIQMIARVRDIRTKTVHVFIGGNDTSFGALDVAALTGRPAFASVTGYRAGFMALLHLLDVHRALETRCALEAFAYYFWSLVVHSGAQIVFPGAAAAASTTTTGGVLVHKASVTPAPPAVPVTMLQNEAWWAHDWHTPPAVLDYEPGCAVSVTGTLLQRAHKLHPNHVMDARVLAFTRAPQPVQVAQPDRLPDWVTREMSPRYRAWAQLMAAKVFGKIGGGAVDAAHLDVTRTAVRRRRMLATATDAVSPHVLVYAPPCARVRHATDAAAARAYADAVDVYLDPAKSWMDVTQQAWILAGMDVALCKGAQPCNDVLFGSPMPTTAVTEALQIVTNVQACLSCIADTSTYVDVGAAWGASSTTELSYHKRTSSSAALVHFTLTEVRDEAAADDDDDTPRTHVVCCRAEGSPDAHSTADLVKLCLIAAAEDVAVASCTVLYMLHGSYVRVRPAPASVHAHSLARSSPAYMPAWKPLDKRGFVWVPRHTADTMYVCWGGKLHCCTTPAQVALQLHAGAELGGVESWVAWGVTQWTRHASEDAVAALALHALRLFDLEDAVHSALRLLDDGILCIHQASVVSVPQVGDVLDGSSAAAAAGYARDEDGSYGAMQAVVRVFVGVCVKRFVVYFWNGKPQAIRLPAFAFR